MTHHSHSFNFRSSFEYIYMDDSGQAGFRTVNHCRSQLGRGVGLAAGAGA